MGEPGSITPCWLMTGPLEILFGSITAPTTDQTKPHYAVLPVANYESYFVGKDRESCACLLITTTDHLAQRQLNIRLKSIDVQFDLFCHLKRGLEPAVEGRFTVIRCRSRERETIRYFLSVCYTVVCMLGDRPSRSAIASAVHRLAALFQKTLKPPTRTVYGLFGELYLISRSTSPLRTLTAWRADNTARFDFIDGEVRLDVKATSGRIRSHVFSYEQCSPPPGTIAVVASMFVESVSGGVTLQRLVDSIAADVASDPDLVLKLHEVIATTLGTSLNGAMALAFDLKLTESSLRIFGLSDVPAIRGEIPVGVSNVHFRSDLSALNDVPFQALIMLDPTFGDLLPPPDQRF